MGAEFVGAGWAFPLRVDPTGKVALVEGTTELEESIRLILMTAPGERPMRPERPGRARTEIIRKATFGNYAFDKPSG